jgi:hypothetical protein
MCYDSVSAFEPGKGDYIHVCYVQLQVVVYVTSDIGITVVKVARTWPQPARAGNSWHLRCDRRGLEDDEGEGGCSKALIIVM